MVQAASRQLRALRGLQWDQFEALVRAALQSLNAEAVGDPTIEEITSEMVLSLKTTLLLAGTGLHGSMKVIAEELVRRQLSFASPITLPLRFYDLATNAMVDNPSTTILSLAGLKTIVDSDAADIRFDDSSPSPIIMKQYASQAIVDFYTDWEEYYRTELGRAHQCSKHDFQIEYFGDLSKSARTTSTTVGCAVTRRAAGNYGGSPRGS